MTLVSGELKLVTDKPEVVSQVWLRAPGERLHGTGMVTTGSDSEPVKNGVVSFTALPGPLVMVLLSNGIPGSTVRMLVPDKANATLRECIEAVGLADDGALDALEELALEVARVAAQIASADKLEVWASETAAAAEQAQISKNEANSAANRAVVHEHNAEQYEINAESAAGRAASAADNVRGKLQGFAEYASESADSAAVSAIKAKTYEANSKAHESSALSSAERAEFAAEEVIQQVEGDFATRNYVDAVGQDVERITESVAPIDNSRDNQFSIKDSDGRVAFSVDSSGRVTIPDLDTGATASEIHIFLAAGQSNMMGFARPVGGDLDPNNPRVMQYGVTANAIETAPAILDNPGGQIGLSPARVFANEYLKTQPDHVQVLLVPYAWGGTGFNSGSGTGATWDDRQASGDVRDLYTESVAQTLDAIAASESGQLKGILWHQGESNQNDSFEAYSAQLDRLIDNYRRDLKNANLPFLIGQMTQEGFEVSPNKRVIDAVHQDTLRRKRYTGFAPSAPESTNYNDTTHFSRRGVEHLGAEYVAAYFRALDNAPGFGPQQPVNIRAEFINGTLTVVWEQQPRRVTGYRVEYRIDGGEWVSVSRQYPMNLGERVTGLSGTVAEVRVTCLNLAQETAQLTRTIAPHIQW